MQESQIKVAAAEVLAEVQKNPQPASEILNAYTRSRRYIGSKDRRALADSVWGVLRAWARLEYACPKASLADKIEAFLADNYPHSDAPEWVQWEVPEWLISHIETPEIELPALLQPAPIVLRAVGTRDKIQKSLAAEGIETTPTELSPLGLILQKRCNLNESRCYKTGLIEVQDEGSQLVALETGIKAGETVLDYCAGAGGKSLAFAQMMNQKGTIVAHDVSRRSLDELEKRAARAGVKNIKTALSLKPTDYPTGFSHVVVDAPCSGTGTWRRCPDARWKLTPQLLADVVQKQRLILDEAKDFVAQDGFLSYMTCSLTRDENGNQVARFLDENPHFVLIKQRQFSPAKTGTDGLFVAVLRRVR